MSSRRPTQPTPGPVRKRQRSLSPDAPGTDTENFDPRRGRLAQLDIPTSPGHESLPPSSPVPYARQFSDDDDDDVGGNSTGGRRGLNASEPDRLDDEESELPLVDDTDMLIPHDVDDYPAEDEDADGEDLIGDGMMRDYVANPELDRYDADGLDDEEDYEELDAHSRAAVDAQLRRRDVLEGRLPAAFLDDGEDMGDLEFQARRRRRRAADDAPLAGVDDDLEMEGDVLLEGMLDLQDSTVAEFLAMDRPRMAIKREFKAFLLSYVDQRGESVYGPRIKSMCELNHESLVVDYEHLENSNAIMAYLLANHPAAVLDLFDEAAFEVVLIHFDQYDRIHPAIHVRISGIKTLHSIRDLRETHLNTLVRISGVVTRRTGVFPQLKYVKYDCVKCGAVIGPIHQDASTEVRVRHCPNCQSRGPFTLNSEQTVYRNFQKLTLQETPGTVPPGRLPRHREVILLWDLIDCARPGEEIEITAVYRHNFDLALNNKNGFPVFSTVLEANHVSKRDDEFAAISLTDDDIKAIKQLARDPKIGRRLIKSIAPSIYGHQEIKTALCLALFGGVPKNVNNKHRIRGDINILLLGDPGTAKSQFLKYVEKTAHRAVYTTGQGASAVGLTASVRKDPVSKEWTLEGGALVLADKGVCLIDEFDKMNDADRTSIHEAMEQQSISISKAGIVTSLHARCCIIAAANPVRGRYNTNVPFSQNVDLTEPILSRFDVLCVVKDKADPELDEQLAEFVVSSHRRSHPKVNEWDLASITTRTDDASIIPQELLKKYIMYAKDKVQPQLAAMDQDKVAKLYGELRRESLQTGSIPITVRHLESMIRMAEAHARMHLRDHVRADDVDLAISVMLDSFISTQKYTVMRQLRRAFAKYIRYSRDNDELLLFSLNDLVAEARRIHQYAGRGRAGAAIPILEEMPDSQTPVVAGGAPSSLSAVTVKVDDLAARAREFNIHDVEPFLRSTLFQENGFEVRVVGNVRKIIKA